MDEESKHLIDEVTIKDHLDPDVKDECGYCGQVFGPDFIVIEKMIHGRKWHFCSEECLRDFKDASDFKDQNLEEKDPEVYDQHQDEQEDF
jgi:YHS domain-containing protein